MEPELTGPERILRVTLSPAGPAVADRLEAVYSVADRLWAEQVAVDPLLVEPAGSDHPEPDHSAAEPGRGRSANPRKIWRIRHQYPFLPGKTAAMSTGVERAEALEPEVAAAEAPLRWVVSPRVPEPGGQSHHAWTQLELRRPVRV